MKRSRIDLTGPLAPQLSEFVAELRRLGYTAAPVKKHFYLLAHLSRWLEEQGLGLADVATSRVEPFFAARRGAGVANLRTRASLSPLVTYLRGRGVVPAAEVPAPTSGAERILEGFGTYLTRERGLVEGTVRFYVHIARLLVDEQAVGDGAALSGLSAHDVTGFTTRFAKAGDCRLAARRCRRCGRSCASWHSRA